MKLLELFKQKWSTSHDIDQQVFCVFSSSDHLLIFLLQSLENRIDVSSLFWFGRRRGSGGRLGGRSMLENLKLSDSGEKLISLLQNLPVR